MPKANGIREAVEAELASVPLAASITVMNLDGNIPLNGTVHSYPQLLRSGRGGLAPQA